MTPAHSKTNKNNQYGFLFEETQDREILLFPLAFYFWSLLSVQGWNISVPHRLDHKGLFASWVLTVFLGVRACVLHPCSAKRGYKIHSQIAPASKLKASLSPLGCLLIADKFFHCRPKGGDILACYNSTKFSWGSELDKAVKSKQCRKRQRIQVLPALLRTIFVLALPRSFPPNPTPVLSVLKMLDKCIKPEHLSQHSSYNPWK